MTIITFEQVLQSLIKNLRHPLTVMNFCARLWVVMSGFGWFSIVLVGFGWIVLANLLLWEVLHVCELFRVVLTGFGWFWVAVVGFSWLHALTSVDLSGSKKLFFVFEGNILKIFSFELISDFILPIFTWIHNLKWTRNF